MIIVNNLGLSNRENPIEPQILRLDDLESLQQSYFDASRPTKMAAHGYNGDPGAFNSTKDGTLNLYQPTNNLVLKSNFSRKQSSFFMRIAISLPSTG